MKHTLWAMLALTFAAASVRTAAGEVSAATKEPGSCSSQTRKRTVRAYIELLRSDIKGNRAQIMGMVMQLDAGDAAKFWPIYKEFES